MINFVTNFNPETKILCGSQNESCYNLRTTLGDVIIDTLNREPCKISQVSDNSRISLTNADIIQRTKKIAVWLTEIGCSKSDIIGVIARNTENLAPLLVAALLCGSPINTLDTTFEKAEIVHMFSSTKPKHIFCDEDKYDVVKESLEELALKSSSIYTMQKSIEQVTSIQDILQTTPENNFENFSSLKTDDASKHVAFIVCSSGTTGLSKGVCLSHSAILHGSNIFNLLTKDIFLSFSSLYWLSGVIAMIGTTIAGCTRIITDIAFSPKYMLHVIEKYKVTVLLSPPSQMAMILHCPDIRHSDLSSLRLYVCGGSNVPSILVSQMNSYLKYGCVNVVYGLTEIGGVCAIHTNDTKLGTVGKLSNNIQAKIIDNYGKNLEIDQIGEIFIKPMFRFLGYYGRTEETNKILDKDQFFESGDIGYFDEDGYLFIIDRKKDIIKYKGFQYSPSEIENMILELPGVSQVIVCGVPDPICTDLPTALVIKTKNFDVSKDEIYDHVALKLSDPKHLRGGIYFVDSLPMTASGKYIRANAKQIAIKLCNEGK